MRGDRPPKCPVCDYDLRGLPCPHRCPECGNAYDERTRVWYPRHARALIPVALFAPGLMLVIAAGQLIVGRHAGWRDLLFSSAGTVVCAGCAVLIWRAHRRRAVAISRAGICLRTGASHVLMSWEEVDDIAVRDAAVIRRGDNVDVVVYRHHASIQKIESFFDRATAEEFRASALAARDMYLHRPAH
jgi:hypothetical protein